ncbi:MAG: hypothetical protein EXS59_00170 [Candidatus Taylorbacteria bacterium]|nr:hypothetical protein [Candidatus Taylorbacteria bacterium]
METTVKPTRKSHEKLSLVSFTVAIGFTVFLYILLLKTLFPNLWVRQLVNGFWPIFWTAIASHLFMGKFEFFFHRYILHELLFVWLLRKWKQVLILFWWFLSKFEWLLKKFEHDHRLHHALTPIFQERHLVESQARAKVVSRYPIREKKQYQSSFFPYWGLAGFVVFFCIITVPLQLLLPHTPIMLGSLIGMTFSYCLYEMLHALEHTSFWEKTVENPKSGKLGKKIWGFHAAHHANVMSNMAISGFFGLPLFDWIFGTYKQPQGLLVNGTWVIEGDFVAPVPCRFIRWLDEVAIKLKTA